MVSVLFCLTLILTGGERAGAAGGDLDLSFNPGGLGADFSLNVLALQPDGKIVIGGVFTAYNGNSAAADNIARLNADGTLDTTFNSGGAGTDGSVAALAVQPDGKIIVGGHFFKYNGKTTPAGLIRLNANGTLDTSFNQGGSGASHFVYAIALQPDGKIIVVGEFADYNGTTVNHIARLNADGTLDSTFNPGGTGTNGALYAAAVLPDGKIVIGGDLTTYNGNAAASDWVARLHSNGTLDTSFNPGGLGADSRVTSLAVQPGGKIVIGGWFTSYNGNAAAGDKVARLNANGTLDTSFNSGGVGADGFVYDLAVQADGKIVIVGQFTSYNQNAAASNNVARLNANGTLDTTFNLGGEGTGGPSGEAVGTVTVQPDGKILIGGDFTTYNGDAAASNRVMRLLPATGALAFSSASYSVAETAANAVFTLTRTGGTDNRVVAKVTPADGTTTPADYRFKPGALDPKFNTGGAGADATVYDVALQPDGKIIIAGYFASYNGNGAASDHVARLKADGTLDTTFNPGGLGANNAVHDVAVQPDGKILIAGIFTGYNGDATAGDGIARLNANGTLDTTFNAGGTGVDVGNGRVVNTVVLQPDGKIIIGGRFTSYNGDWQVSDGVARLNADGTLDTSFNYNFTGAEHAVVYEVALQADGKVIIGGNFDSFNRNDAASDGVARLTPDGKLDTTFNYNSAGADGQVLALALQPDGKIIIGGTFVSYNGSFTASDFVARLNTNGKLDATFNSGGGGAGPNGTVFEVSLQPDGKVLIGGFFTSYNNNDPASDYITRLNVNGTLDSTFNAGGLGADNTVRAVALQPDGKIVIGGDFTSYNNEGAVGDFVTRLGGELFVAWAAGDASNKTVQFPVVNDTVYEGNETLNLALSIVAGGASLGAPASSVLTIVDNEAPPRLSINNVTVTEGNSGAFNAVFTVNLIGATSKTVTVNYQTVNGTATAPADYSALPLTTLTFSPGQTSKTINVPVKGELVDELDETFKVMLSGATNATIVTGTGTGTIKDNDTATISINNPSAAEPDTNIGSLVFTVKLSVPSSRTVTVKYQTADGTAVAPVDYGALPLTTLTFSPGQTVKTVTVPVKGDLVKEMHETLFLNLSGSVNAAISDNQGMGSILNDD